MQPTTRLWLLWNWAMQATGRHTHDHRWTRVSGKTARMHTAQLAQGTSWFLPPPLLGRQAIKVGYSCEQSISDKDKETASHYYYMSLVSYSNCIFYTLPLTRNMYVGSHGALSLKICTSYQLMDAIQDRDFERLEWLRTWLHDGLPFPWWIYLTIRFCREVLLKCPCMVSSAFSSMTPYAMFLIWSHFSSALRKSSLWPGFPLWNDFSIKYLVFHWREVDFEVSYLPGVPIWTEIWDITRINKWMNKYVTETSKVYRLSSLLISLNVSVQLFLLLALFYFITA